MCTALAIGLRFSFMQLNVDGRWPRLSRAALHAVTLVCAAAAALVLAGHNGPAMLAMQSAAMLSIVCLIGAALWLGARIAYLPLYALGVRMVRTLAFGVSMVGIVMLLLPALRAGF